MKTSKLHKEIDAILQIYFPDEYYEELRLKTVIEILNWHNKKEYANQSKPAPGDEENNPLNRDDISDVMDELAMAMSMISKKDVDVSFYVEKLYEKLNKLNNVESKIIRQKIL